MVGTALGAGVAAVVGHQLVTRRAGAPTGARDAQAAGAAREVVHAARLGTTPFAGSAACSDVEIRKTVRTARTERSGKLLVHDIG